MNERNEPKIVDNQNVGGIAFDATYYEGMRKHMLYLEQELVEEKAKVKYLEDKVEFMHEIIKANESLKTSEKGWWFLYGFLVATFFLVLNVLIFGERAAS